MKFVRALYFQVFQPLLAFGEKASRDTTRALRAARIGFFPEWYLSLSYFSALVAGVLVAVLAAGTLAALPGELSLPALLTFVIGSGAITALLVRLAFLMYPRVKASGRARTIDSEFPSVVTLCYALARGGLGIVDIFRAVAEEEEVYGEISKEFALIVREIETFGEDVNTALLTTASTTPSETLRRFLEGLVTILNSGASPRDYFRRQAETQLGQAEMTLEKELEQAALLAEVYVSGLLVLPLLLIVILSVLSGLGGDGDTFLPLIVFGLVPIGTVSYLLLLDLMVPSEPLEVPVRQRSPLIDFGLESIPKNVRNLPPPGNLLWSEAARKDGAFRLRFGLFLHALLCDLQRAWDRLVSRALEKPTELAALSGSTAFVVFLVGASYVLFTFEPGYWMVFNLSSLFATALFLALVPIGLFHEWRIYRTRRIDSAVPDMLRKLSGFNERGIGIMSAFQILGKENSGPLTPAIAAMDRDAGWSSNFRDALTRMCTRLRSLRMLKVGVLFERATDATSNLKDVIDIVATDTSAVEKLRARRRQGMMSYVVIIYAVFAVFLYVVYMVTSLFFSDGGLAATAAAAAAESPGGAGMAAGLAPQDARLLFFHAVLLQGICCGFVAGRLGEGYLLSGIKHAAILGTCAWLVFWVGVI